MLERVTAPRHGAIWASVALVAVLAVTALVLASRPWMPTTDVASEGSTVEPGAVVAEPAPLVLPEHPRVLVFGDSWTYGSAALNPRLGYAYVLGDLLGAEIVVDGVRGSGYLKPGLDGPSYPDRVGTLSGDLDPDLVILQGSINDRLLYPEGYEAAVTGVWDAVAALYPEASVVVLGPAPHVLPVQDAVAAMDRDLATLAAARSWWYVSPVAEAWITDENYREVIDTSEWARNHPSTAGHAYLAERLAAALERITGAAAD